MKHLFFFIFIFPLLLSAQEFPSFEFSHAHEVSTVEFAYNGRMATGTSAGEVYLWNTSAKAKDNYFNKEKDIVLKMAFSPDGNSLVTGGKDKSIYVWDVKKGILKSKVEDVTKKAITAIAISYDGSLYAHAGLNGIVVIRNISDNTVIQTLEVSEKGVSSLDFSHSSHLLTVGDMEGRVTLYDGKTGELTQRFIPGSGKIRTVRFSPNDRLVAVGTDDKKVFVYDLHLGVNLHTYTEHKSVIYCLDFSPDGKFLATGGLGNHFYVHDLKTHQVVMHEKGFYKLLSLGFSFDGKYLAVADYTKKVKIYDVASLNINEKNTLNKAKNRDVLTRIPKITIHSPIVKEGGKYVADQQYITVTGKVECEAGLFMLLVGGQETEVKEGNTFSAQVKLTYWDNAISVKAIDFEKQITEVTINAYRPLDESEVASKNLQRQGMDYALIIGTNEYQSFNNLTNPVYDATTIADELKNNYNFQTTLLTDPTLSEVYQAIRNFSKKTYSDQDQLFIFIAGHGEFDDVFNEGYLVSKNSEQGDEVKRTYISHSNLRTLTNNIKCKHVFLVMDVCFGGTFDPKIAHRGSEKPTGEFNKNQYILRKMKHKTRQYLTSGGKEYVPDGRPGKHSPFARKFLEALRSGGGEDGVLTISETMTYVERVNPEPRHGEFGENEPGSKFLFIKK